MDSRKILFIRLTLWFGIIADLVMGIQMMMPNLFIKMNGFTISSSPEFAISLLFGMPVMIGWSIVLFWADRKPIKRHGVLLCLLPIPIAYVGIEIYCIISGLGSLSTSIPLFFMQALLITCIVISIIFAKKLNKKIIQKNIA